MKWNFPQETFIYLADKKYMPYGNKSPNFVRNRVVSLCETLINNYNVKMIIIACNTASSILKFSPPLLKIPVVLMDLTTFENYPILCTKNTSKFYKNSIKLNALARIVEENITNPKQLKLRVKSYLRKYNLEQHNALVLGCTHYELVKNIFMDCYPNTRFMCPSEELIERIKRLNIIEKSNKINGEVYFISTDETKSYNDLMWYVAEKNF